MNFRQVIMSADSAAALRVALLVLGPLLSFLLQECACAPASAGDLRSEWKSPCGEKSPPMPGTVLVPGEPVRHVTTKAMKRVRKQLKVAYQHINDSEHVVQRLYGNFSAQFGESQYTYDWLPRKQLQWFKKNKQCRNDKVAEVLPVFHKSLENFSVTFEAMKRYGESQIEERELNYLRKSFLRNITIWHKMLHCETETTIHNMRMPMPERATHDILTEDKWPSNPDLTRMLMRDWGVISLYKRFLSEWSNVMKLLMKKDLQACAKSTDRREGPPLKRNRIHRRRQDTPS